LSDCNCGAVTLPIAPIFSQVSLLTHAVSKFIFCIYQFMKSAIVFSTQFSVNTARLLNQENHQEKAFVMFLPIIPKLVTIVFHRHFTYSILALNVAINQFLRLKKNADRDEFVLSITSCCHCIALDNLLDCSVYSSWLIAQDLYCLSSSCCFAFRLPISTCCCCDVSIYFSD